MTTNGTLYRLRGLTRVHRTGAGVVRAVDGIDLQIAAGEFVAIEGASGSGKTTLLQLLGALDTPSEGSIELDGRQLADLSESERTKLRREDLGFVFQQFNLIPTMTAAENVEAALVGTLDRRARRERARELLERVGLGHRVDHLPSRLSGGEQQRVAIARALANRPRVVLADEPTGNLDSATARDVMGLLGSLAAERGVTVVVVTHADEVARLAGRRVQLRDGRVFADAGGPAPQGLACEACGAELARAEEAEHGECEDCGKRFRRRTSAPGRAWKRCPACAGERRTVAHSRACPSCGARHAANLAHR